MAPQPVAKNPDGMSGLNHLLSSISSIFKSKPPSFRTSGEGIDGMKPKDLVTPSLPVPPIITSEEPTGLETSPWSKVPDLQKTDDYDELMSNPWGDKLKRSIQYPARLIMGMDRASIDTPVQQLWTGEYHLSYTQELSLVMLGSLITVFMVAAMIWAIVMVKIKRKPRYRIELGRE
ncbi:hypothetical protein B9Z19DRAFT_1126836 [Tuber borchii]|uniref:Uncharacterized protein n=1 Tax=Tuber borchii TaxID=42251 RepID=A0A2T6ZSC5_TUBBO|nr:hypothetical protein B9Z19DRAFT_1126836 [Tuber borchii]